MIVRLVAIGALHIQFAAHMYIIVLRGEVETLVEVAVLDAVPSAVIEVAFAAILTRRRTHRTRRRKQVHTFGWVALITFSIRAKIGMAGQAIHIFRVRQGGVFSLFPAIARMAGHTLILIAL